MMNLKLTKVQIHPTNRCNLSCIFCDVPYRYANAVDINEKKFITVSEELCKLHPSDVAISGGGEPLLRPRLLTKMMKILHSNNIRIGLITNGTLVSNRMAKTITECCHDYRLSIHSVTAKLDEFMRGKKGSIKLSFDGVKRIVYWKWKMKKDTPRIDMAMVITKFNIDEIEKMIKKAFFLRVNKVSLRMVHKWGEKYHPSEKQMKELKNILNRCGKLATKKGIELRYDFIPEDIFHKRNEEKSFDISKQILCPLPFREMVIFADGRVSPCCNFIIEDITNTAVDSVLDKTLSGVWFGKKFNYLRGRILENDEEKLPKECKECSADLRPIAQEYKIVRPCEKT